jgi:cytochrome c553
MAQSNQPSEANRALATELGCLSCHGDNGIGVDEETPNLAGQDWSYLMRQLRSFSDPDPDRREGNGDYVRYHFSMEAESMELTHDQMDALASYFSNMECIPAKAPDPDGIPGAVRTCTRCHGLYGVNLKPGIPDLSGQKFRYIEQQLQNFRASRFGTDPLSEDEVRYDEVMTPHAVPLSDSEIRVIADYFSSLTCS